MKIPLYWKGLGGYLLLSLFGCFFMELSPFEWREILINRGLFVVLFSFVIWVRRKIPMANFQLISLILAYSLLGRLYTETAWLNAMFLPKQDALISEWEEQLFGLQLAQIFSSRYPSFIFSELMFLGYFSYYLIPFFIIFQLRAQAGKMLKFGNYLILAFIIYYIIFILFPVAGPQFYYPYPQNQIQAQGLFGHLVKLVQQIGEAPTAAFPSSHVGISVVILLWLRDNYSSIIKYILPFSVLLLLATVYIKAHYAVDVIAGLASGVLIYYFLQKSLNNEFNRN
ncbi:phosphatase PAP2 family protein [Ornithobacterium rhinotracheale]|uniref:Phosphatase PAP2 family protein n=1 Tax=Ornithobacterium rhinotracheale TaxID=28251 RepID=A0A410JTP7_ORNRH|nr:phosphatase PAP2 family protein [Ornithobacterium rhinotracheale]QAR31379.1 phosphatase PAP2 family protein [Ornithobacterium rhinotracheale]